MYAHMLACHVDTNTDMHTQTQRMPMGTITEQGFSLVSFSAGLLECHTSNVNTPVTEILPCTCIQCVCVCVCVCVCMYASKCVVNQGQMK